MVRSISSLVCNGAYHFVPRVNFIFDKDCPPLKTPRVQHCNPRELVIILLYEMFTVVGLTQTNSQQGDSEKQNLDQVSILCVYRLRTAYEREEVKDNVISHSVLQSMRAKGACVGRPVQ